MKKLLLSAVVALLALSACNPLDKEITDYHDMLYQKWWQMYFIENGEVMECRSQLHFEADGRLYEYPVGWFYEYSIDGRQLTIKRRKNIVSHGFYGNWFIYKHEGNNVVYMERYYGLNDEGDDIYTTKRDTLMLRLLGISLPK